MQQNTSAAVSIGVLVLRIGFGVMFILHGYPKVMGGQETWEQLGQAMGVFGVTFMPQFWGLMAAFSEFLGGMMLILGLAVRPISLLLLMTMIVAAAMHLSASHGLQQASHAIEAGIVFLSLLIIGGGPITVVKLLTKKS